MSEIIKVAKFKTNVSFVGSNGVFYVGGSVVQLPVEDFEGQVEVCQLFSLPVPELIEELDAEVEEAVIEEVKKRSRGRAASAPKEEQPSSGEQPSSEVDADL